MSIRLRLILGLLSAVAVVGTVAPASAQVLTEGAERRLCEGGRMVPSRLALAIVAEARATTFAATANAGGTSPDDLTVAEAVQVLRALNSGTSRPFGPDVDLTADKDAADAWTRVSTATLELANLSRRPNTVGRVTYQLVRIGAPVTAEPRYNSARLFDEHPVYEITCTRASAPLPEVAEAPRPDLGSQIPTPETGSDTAGIQTRRASAPPLALRIRGAASDLYLGTGGDLSALKPATLGFSRDEIADTETVNFNAAIGLAFETPDLTWAATPFVAWQYKDVAGAGDIDNVSPGLLLTHRMAGDDLVLHSRLELAYLIAREQSSEQLKARLYVDPAIRTSVGILFGGWLRNDGPFGFRPDLTLIADLSEARDPGSNAAFLAGGSYRGLGGDLRLFVDYERIEGLTLQVGRRQLWLSGDLAIDEAARWYGKLEYKFKSSPIGIGLTYSEGQNDDTFKDEDTTALELTFRY